MRMALACLTLLAVHGGAWGGTTKLDVLWGPPNGVAAQGVVVFIHGHANCVGGNGADGRCTNDARGYWLNSASDGGDDHDLMNEATLRCGASGCGMSCSGTSCAMSGSWQYWYAVALRYDAVNQSFLGSSGSNHSVDSSGATADVAKCLIDLAHGTNASGCNPYLNRASYFNVVAHSEGGAIVDRILSSGWWPQLSDPSTGAFLTVVTDAGALAGSKAASALYGVDGASNFCTSLVSWLSGWYFKDTGNASLTRGTVLGEANNGKAGKSPIWVNKITTAGGSGSANNNHSVSIAESRNDTSMGLLAGCIGYSADDDTDGILWMYDSDPTANPSSSNGGKTRSQYTGYYWHWFGSWANHSHNRNDAYVKIDGFQTTAGCSTRAPGTCMGQYAW
jgi:hypothetical protein